MGDSDGDDHAFTAVGIWPVAKGAFIDYGQGPVVQLQGYQGWTPAGAPPIVLNAPDWGYTVDVSTGAWTSPDGSTGGLL